MNGVGLVQINAVGCSYSYIPTNDQASDTNMSDTSLSTHRRRPWLGQRCFVIGTHVSIENAAVDL
jgi:hypothetical protein